MRRSSYTPIAVALVMQDGYGNARIVGSQHLQSVSLEMGTGVMALLGEELASCDPVALSHGYSWRLQVEGFSRMTHQARQADPAAARHLPSGIYLPDVSYTIS